VNIYSEENSHRQPSYLTKSKFSKYIK